MAYTYELGVIESEIGDSDGVFVAENSHDMRRLVDRMNSLTEENAKLREQLAEAVEIMKRARMNEGQDGCTRHVIGWCKCWRHAIDAFVAQHEDTAK